MMMILLDAVGMGRTFTRYHYPHVVTLILFLSAILQSEGSSRRRLNIDDSISEHLKVEHSMGISHPRFTITAVSPSSGEEYYFDVVEANSAVTDTTTYSVDGGPSQPVEDYGVKFLVSDPDVGDGAHRFTFIVVDEQTGEVKGISQVDDEKPVTVAQFPHTGTSQTEANLFEYADFVTVSEAEEFVPPEWSCGVTDTFEENIEDIMNMQSDDGDIASVLSPQFNAPTKKEARMNGHHRKEHNRAHDHDRSGHVHLHPSDSGSNFADLIKSVTHDLNTHPSGKGRSHRGLGSYPTDTFPNKWSYLVNLYIEIDNAFVQNSGGGNLTLAIQYVNSLISAISVTYEREIDTHLHVQHIAKTNLYDDATSTQHAIGIMFRTYQNATGWHYQEADIDLHHGLIGRPLGGGIATVGTVCDHEGGFGVSTGVQGSFQSIGATLVWDYFVVAHEIGHNFGSLHTHDPRGYDPVVDTCGIRNDDGWTCSNELPLEGSATIMGYCHLCPGRISNLGYTFGGTWEGGDRHDLSNWKNSDVAGDVSSEPRRVPKIMWEHVSSRGVCVSPGTSVPTFTCTKDEDCNDGNACTDDTCDVSSSMCKSTLPRENCCGNLLCETGELGTCSDCGPFTLSAPMCVGQCWIPVGIMFDIFTKNDITVSGLTLRLYNKGGDASGVIAVYTAEGGYGDKLVDQELWTKVASQTISTPSWVFVDLNFEEGINIGAGITQAFYVSSFNSALIVASKESQNPVANNEDIDILTPARIVNGLWGGGTSTPDNESVSWEGKITYSRQMPCIQDEDCFDGNSCTVDTCILSSGTCENIMLSNCCGNDMCELNEVEGCTADCGPWFFGFPICTSYGNGLCYQGGQGVMIDIIAIQDISLSGIALILWEGTNIKLDFYTAWGSFDLHHSDPLMWRLLNSTDIFSLAEPSLIDFNIPSTEIQAGATQSFYIVASSDTGNGFYIGSVPAPYVADEKIEIRPTARGFPSSEPFSNSYPMYSFQGGIIYSSTGPTSSPTAMPTESPTMNPTTTSLPSMSVAPTLYPTASQAPTQSFAPSKVPSFRPSTSPGPSVSLIPSKSIKPSLSALPSVSERPSTPPSLQPSTSSEPSQVSSTTAPTSSSSTNPSASFGPTIQTSYAPSASSRPTKKKSETPTFLPSQLSSQVPSISAQPSTEESHSPSVSLSPSTPNPSASFGPTTEASDLPSASLVPTKEKSEIPSYLPSKVSSLTPSISTQPSTKGSYSPSISLSPTSSSTTNPSESFGPTIQASGAPSASLTPTKKDSGVATKSPNSSAPGSRWFMNWDTLICGIDCPKSEGGYCGGYAPSYCQRFDTAIQCCNDSFQNTPSLAGQCLTASLSTSSEPASAVEPESLFHS